MVVKSGICQDLNWADQICLITQRRHLTFQLHLVLSVISDLRLALTICTPSPGRFLHILENSHWKSKLKPAAGYVRNPLERVASTGISTLICLTPQHTAFISTNGKKVFQMLRAGGTATEQRQNQSTNLEKNASLLTKEISSVKSISFQHESPSVIWRLTWGIPSDRPGCGTRHIWLDSSIVDFVIYRNKERKTKCERKKGQSSLSR